MPDDPARSSDLDRDEQRARIQKLRAETRSLRNAAAADAKKKAAEEAEFNLRSEKAALDIQALRQQLSPETRALEKVKVVAGASGLVVAVAGGIGLFTSTYQWLASTSLAQEVRQEERLDKALLTLAEKSPAQRLSAVASLQSFLGDIHSERRERVLLALANQIAIDDSITVRNAIVATFGNHRTTSRSPPELARVLDSLVQTSRGLVAEGDLWRRRRPNLYLQPKADSAEGRAQSVADAMAALLRRGVQRKDLSGTYLGSVDLAGIAIDGFSFDDAILAWSTFTDSSCRECTFRGADLSRTDFVSADLRLATFGDARQRGGKNVKPRLNYIAMQIVRATGDEERGGARALETPRFDCADLRDASFAGFPAFEFTSDRFLGLVGGGSMMGLDFANIEGADFTQSGVYGLRPRDEPCSPVPSSSSGGIVLQKLDAVAYTAEIDESLGVGASDCDTKYEKTYEELALTLMRTNAEAAVFPEFIRAKLLHQPYVLGGVLPEPTCKPKAPWFGGG